MTITEVLPTLKALNYKDKIRAIQFLANEVAKEEDGVFVNNQTHDFASQTNAFEASQILQKMLDGQKVDTAT
ncbi:hypothetical protein BH20ACI4_BH20ACI4_05820 [soil metagenome]